MATYTINYLTGDTETVLADNVEYDPSAADYTFYLDGKVAALAPVANVRSVHHKDDGGPQYPYEDGDVIVLGPETFTDHDREVISHLGVGYTRRPGPNLFAGRKPDGIEVTS
jgi:hypothetical protein